MTPEQKAIQNKMIDLVLAESISLDVYQKLLLKLRKTKDLTRFEKYLERWNNELNSDV